MRFLVSCRVWFWIIFLRVMWLNLRLCGIKFFISDVYVEIIVRRIWNILYLINENFFY